MQVEEILNYFKKSKDLKAIEGMKKVGINPDFSFGIRIPNLRALAKKIGVNHFLAVKLWTFGYRETMILASMIADPKRISEEEIQDILNSPNYNYWEVVDQTVMNLFYRLSTISEKIVDWCNDTREFVRRTGFVSIAVLAGKEKSDTINYEYYAKLLIDGSIDERVNVRNSVSWALRQIGKKSCKLNDFAISLAYEISLIDSRSSKWIAKDVLKELESLRIKERLKIN